jgi:hypothetical protein
MNPDLHSYQEFFWIRIRNTEIVPFLVDASLQHLGAREGGRCGGLGREIKWSADFSL